MFLEIYLKGIKIHKHILMDIIPGFRFEFRCYLLNIRQSFEVFVV